MQRDLRSVPDPSPERADDGSDSIAFEDFFVAHKSRLFGALCVMTGNRSEAEEIMQDAFLAVLERWDLVSRMDDPEAYLFRTAMNVFRQRLRRASVRVRKALSVLPSDDALALVEARDEATHALALLTPRERQAIVLTAYLGYPSEAAGRILGIKASTVRVLTTRARATLRPIEGDRRDR
jgi:RNA polymerase sigma-70 factor (ECF subfamily)